MGKKSSNIAAGTLFAAAVGYVVGILTAPKSGRETRADIQRATVRAKTEAERRLKQAYSELNQTLEESMEVAESVKQRARSEYEKAVSRATQVKQKSRELLSAFRDGEADDLDLNMAVEDVNEAIDHLRKFLHKDVQEA